MTTTPETDDDDGRYQCPACQHVDTWDGYEVMGCEFGLVICMECGAEVEVIDLDAPPEPAAAQQTLFEE